MYVLLVLNFNAAQPYWALQW